MNKFFSLVLGFFLTQINADLNICSNGKATSQPVIDYCTSQNGKLEDRCCYAMNSMNLLAIDLIDMNLIEVPNLIEYVNLTVIDLRLNSQLKSSKTTDFLGLNLLDILLLPEQYSCPGDKHVWQIINSTDNPKGILCQHQINICLNSSNDLCIPTRSSCHPNGPNHFQCLCKDNYHGYKCLRQGSFPVWKFSGLVILFTGLLTTFFYLTHRKYVKRD